MQPPRFILVLSSHVNILRAALVTRNLYLVASAQQSFQIIDTEFDPAEVWYKTKKVIAACLDIGRTQSREIAALAIVTQDTETIVWSEQENKVVARGMVSHDRVSISVAPLMDAVQGCSYSGTMAAWLLWNLTGVLLVPETTEFGKTRARSPFDAELAVVVVMYENDALEFASDLKSANADGAIIGAARYAWEKIS